MSSFIFRSETKIVVGEYRAEKSAHVVTSNLWTKPTSSDNNYYALNSTYKVLWGKDGINSGCNCSMQYIRVYLDYAAQTEEQMINLAVMDRGSNTLLPFML